MTSRTRRNLSARPLRELLLLAIAATAYAGVPASTEGQLPIAIGNARRVLDLERALGIAWEHGLQSAVVANGAAVTLANWVYIWGHWPVIVGTAVFLYAWQRHRSIRDRTPRRQRPASIAHT